MNKRKIEDDKRSRDFFEGLFVALIAALIIRQFIVQAYRIPTSSMEDTLLIGDFLLVNKFNYGMRTPDWIGIPYTDIGVDIPWVRIPGFKTPKQNDVVIFRYPQNTSIHFVKRCVALPNDIVFVHEKDLYLHPHEGDEFIKANYPKENIVVAFDQLFVKNPYAAKHPGIHHDDAVINDGQNHMPIFFMPPLKVPDNEYFMMGDNRDHSNDSRFWGTVPYGLIEGTPWFVYFSIDDNYEVRWERMGKTPTDLEDESFIKRAKAEDVKKEKGIF